MQSEDAELCGEQRILLLCRSEQENGHWSDADMPSGRQLSALDGAASRYPPAGSAIPRWRHGGRGRDVTRRKNVADARQAWRRSVKY